MSKREPGGDAFSAVFLILSFFIVGLATLVLIDNTNPDYNADIEMPVIEDVMVVCDIGRKEMFKAPALVAWREGDSIHVKHPQSSFTIQDPTRKCSIE